MKDPQADLFQCVENVEEFSDPQENGGISEPFICEAKRPVTCVVCSREFTAATARANLCSAPSRRERRLQYGAAYRHHGRELRQKLNEMFGGRRPTEQEILQLLRQRKGKS